jgi:hypothetical protein
MRRSRTSWLVGGAVAAALLAGCDQARATPVSDCSSTAPGTVVVASALRNGRATPAPHRVSVPVGGTVQVRVDSDKVVQVHVHGFDLEYDAAPGVPGCVSFVADRAGLFDVEAHPDTLLLQLEVK